MTNEEKKIKIIKLSMRVNDQILHRFIDVESDNLLDEKIEVLESLIKGKKVSQIKNYYKVLEKYPGEEKMWD